MKKYDLLLRRGTALLPNSHFSEEISQHPQDLLTEAQVDIAIQSKKIVGIGSFQPEDFSQVIDCHGLHILPGVIDTQVHFREPGMTHKEDIESGSRAALMGGITAYFEMPNTKPSTTTQDLFHQKLTLSQSRAHTHYAYYYGADPSNLENLSQLELNKNSPGIKVFLGVSTGSLLIQSDEDLEQILKSTKTRIVFHSEDDALLNQRKHLIRPNDPSSHPEWRSAESALTSTKRILALAEKLNRQVHILHISTAEEMDFLQNKKKWATLEVLPQHLYLNAPDCYKKWGTFAQQNPPIRELRHRQRILQALKDGLVDIVASDHAPHTQEEKENPYPQSPSGMPGVQTLLPLMLDLVSKKEIRLTHMTALMTEKPKRIFGIQNKGRIEKGADADFTLVDMGKKRMIEKSWLQSKSPWSPFEGMEIQGWPQGVILAGRLAMWDDEIVLPHAGEAIEFNKPS